jgi:hypothetical protein
MGSVFFLRLYHYTIFYIHLKVLAMALFTDIYTTLARILYNTLIDIYCIRVLQVCVNLHVLRLCYRTVADRSKILFLGYVAINLLAHRTLSVRMADNLTTFTCRLSWNLWATTSWNPQGLSRFVQGLLCLLILAFYLPKDPIIREIYIFLVFFRPLFRIVLCELRRFIVP